MSTKLTKAGLKKLIKEALDEQLLDNPDSVTPNERGALDKIKEEVKRDLEDLQSEIEFEARKLESKATYLRMMVSSLNSTALGGTDDQSQKGLANPIAVLEKGSDRLDSFFRERGKAPLANKIKQLLTIVE